MKVAYFDCFAGISGNMILGALIDAGLDSKLLEREIKKSINIDFHLQTSSVLKAKISGTYVEVKTSKKLKVGQTPRFSKYKDIERIIIKSKLDDNSKETVQTIFQNLARAEGKIHKKSPKDIHFHELGEVDTIVDVVGAVLGMKLLGIEKIYSSPINLGKGMVNTSSGKLPIPAPATIELLKDVPVYSTGDAFELTTPTGAAIISVLATSFCDLPKMLVKNIGYGAGSHNLSFPNLLRVYIGEQEDLDLNLLEDKVFLLETNIDDANPQIYEHLMERLFAAGALDVYLVPAVMKKNRLGIILNVLTEEKFISSLIEVIFQETTTLGIRISEIKRKKLEREIRKVESKYGPVRVKIGRWGKKIFTISPEYEDCKKIAKELKIPLKLVFKEVEKMVAPTGVEPVSAD